MTLRNVLLGCAAAAAVGAALAWHFDDHRWLRLTSFAVAVAVDVRRPLPPRKGRP